MWLTHRQLPIETIPHTNTTPNTHTYTSKLQHNTNMRPNLDTHTQTPKHKHPYTTDIPPYTNTTPHRYPLTQTPTHKHIYSTNTLTDKCKHTNIPT